MKPPTIKRPCHVCGEKKAINNDVMCPVCYREWAFHVAGIAEPPDYQTFDQALMSV